MEWKDSLDSPLIIVKGLIHKVGKFDFLPYRQWRGMKVLLLFASPPEKKKPGLQDHNLSCLPHKQIFSQQ
jgi:hypothetical protein